jgi:hypothetical protein
MVRNKIAPTAKKIACLWRRLTKCSSSAPTKSGRSPTTALERLEWWSWLATIVILLGIVTEAWSAIHFWDLPPSIGELAATLIADGLIGAGLLIEVICILRAIVWTRREKNESDQQVAEANRRAFEAEERASSADRKTEELKAESLKLALQVEQAKRLAGPRNLWDDGMTDIKAATEPFSGTAYDLTIPPIADNRPVPELFEPGSYLLNQLIGTLKSAGWQLCSIEGDIPKRLLPRLIALAAADFPSAAVSRRVVQVPMILVGQATGVAGIRISVGGKDMFIDAAYALVQALNRAGLRTDVRHSFDALALDDQITSDAVHIIIGTRY